MEKYLLTKLNGQTIVTNGDKTHRAQHLAVDEALADGVILDDMIEDLDGFMEDWVPIKQETGWGVILEVYRSDKKFDVVDD